MSSSLRIVISGYYGFSNIGDEAILLSLHQALRQELPEHTELIVLSADPEKTKSQHGLKAISRVDFLAIWRALRGADLLISGGGSLFQDGTSVRSLFYYLLILAIGMFAGCPTMVYAQGIGPLKRSYSRWFTGMVLKHVHLITVRDNESMKELQALGVPLKRVSVTADPVMALPAQNTDAGIKLLKKIKLHAGGDSSPLIGISIRPWEGSEHLLRQLQVVIGRLLTKYQARVVLIPMHYPGDDAITEQLRQRFSPDDRVAVLPQVDHASQLISLMGCLDLLIGVRLHALVFAAIACTPAVAISYDPKVDHFAERMEQMSVGALERMEAEALWDAVTTSLTNQEALRKRAAELSAGLRREALRSAELAAALLQERRA